MPYCLLMIIALGLEVKFDKFDVAVLFACLFLQILNVVDFFVNYR